MFIIINNTSNYNSQFKNIVLFNIIINKREFVCVIKENDALLSNIFASYCY